ncbi:MAG: hypothetical protein KC620_18570, partial [Myxococcales bacterium]|nr:hypothetical protein [Myxococcales bacterium]
ADLVRTTLGALWQALVSGTAPPAGMQPLANALGAEVPGTHLTWFQALRVEYAGAAQIHERGVPAALTDARPEDVSAVWLGALTPAFERAIAAPAATPAAGPSLLVPRFDASRPADATGQARPVQYVLLCVYERGRCPHLPAPPPLLSVPSAPFEMATFFDPDAPQRPVRIELPIDTSPTGLRKFPKSVSFVMGSALRQQLRKVKDLKKPLNAQLDSGSLDVGQICSLSIPIVTICALIVLFIFISLLNLVFFWIPLVKVCVPVKVRS